LCTPFAFSGAFEFECLENRIQVKPRSTHAPSELHKPGNFITFVSSPENGIAATDSRESLAKTARRYCLLMPTKQHRAAEGPRASLVSDRDRQAGLSVAKSISPCWLVNVAFLSLPLWCTPEMR
jgi:hypothetical protein